MMDDYADFQPYQPQQDMPQNPTASSTYTNMQPGQDWYTMAGQGYNDNPMAAQGGEGGPAWVPNNAQPQTMQQPQMSLEQRVAQDQAAVQKTLNPMQTMAGQSGPGTPTGGGSRGTIVGGPANVNAMATPYGGGPGASMTAAGYKPPGAMPTTLMDKYKSFITDPQGGLNSDIFKAILGQGTAAAERGALAKGGNAGGIMPVEMQKAGIAAAGSYLPTMAGVLQGGANTEAGRYGTEATVGQGAGSLGLNAYNSESADQFKRAQGNYGVTQDTNAQLQAQQSQGPMQQLMTMMMQRQLQGY